MRKSFFLIAAALAVFGLNAAQAQHPPTDNPDWLSQAKIVAEAQGISVGEAVRRARLQRLANEQADRFAADDSFAGSWISQDRNGFKVNFAFKGGGAKPLGDPDLAGVSTFSSTHYSLKEINAERQRLTETLKTAGIDVAFELRVRENQLLLYPSDAAKVRTLVSSGALSLRDFVVIIDKPLIRRPEAAVSGGGPTTGSYVDPSDGYTYGNNCTAAFNVSNGSLRGITTAGHCARYDGQTSTHRGIAIGTRRGYREDSGLDVAWFRSDSNTYNNAVLYQTSWYSVTSVGPAAPAVGTAICIIRHDGTQPCSYVKTNGIWFGTDGPYTAMDRDTTVNSDSGAPWLYGSVAYGIHSGDAETSVGVLSFFTPAASLSKMGISVNTN
jgi:hypothetical protein